ncbi:A-kinase-interacting protein 1 isoform X1 [Rana temporaria]|uniref:A-kinase-interacting protein 1 isoform X1 n=1 Tax=Rana temporaria TaxID=8407 RepID=UPI001AADF4C3|nr:A-kinase-interacting protein 1 isoform X1 [Rana temporaria]
MAEEYRRMEESLRRSSERAREVLERARRWEVDWGAAHRSEGIRTQDAEVPIRIKSAGDLVTRRSVQSVYVVSPQDDETPPTLEEETFTAMSHFMRRTTELCEAYHSCIPPRGTSEQEKQHIGRFHHRRSQRATQRPESRPSSPSAPLPPSAAKKRTDPRDIYIEVAPGTYRISAGSPDGPAQTRVVNVAPGQSVDLTFYV